MFLNGLGAFATGITTLVVLVAKFLNGAWITVILVAVLILLMKSVKRHYAEVDKESVLDRPFARAETGHPIMILPVDQWNRITEKALSFALSMSNDIRCVHVQVGDEPDTICTTWDEYVTAPLKAAGANTTDEIVKTLISTLYGRKPDSPDLLAVQVQVSDHVNRSTRDHLAHDRILAEATGLLLAAPQFQWKI